MDGEHTRHRVGPASVWLAVPVAVGLATAALVLLWAVVNLAAAGVAVLGLPPAVAVAVLRYRLYATDRIRDEVELGAIGRATATTAVAVAGPRTVSVWVDDETTS